MRGFWLCFAEESSPKQDEIQIDTMEEKSFGEKHIDLDSIVVRNAPRGKAYTFYLDEEVVLELRHLANELNSNKSKVLNALLRKVLL